MKRYCLSLLICLCASQLMAATPAAKATPPVFRAGAATSNITPDLGGAIVGGFTPFPATNVHDELHARCLVLDDGQTKLAVVVCDLLGMSYTLSREARKLVEAATGIPPQNTLISCVHTHSACSALGDRYKTDQPLEGYQAFVARRIADGVKCAANRLRPAELAFVTAQAPEHVFNRRWHMQPGTAPVNPFGIIDRVKMNPPGGSPNLVEPAGPTDPTISILSLREPQGNPIAVFATYSLHYVGGVRSGDISADYYGFFCQYLARLLKVEDQDPAFMAMLANGTSGDINNVNHRQPRPRRDAYEQMQFVAQDVANKVFAALGQAQYRSNVSLAARYREELIAARHPTAKELAWAKETLAKPEAQPDGKPAKADLSRIYAARTMSVAEQPEKMAIPLQVLRIGDVCIGTMPTEVFCEIGLAFREKSPIKPAFLISLAHGYFGYLPTPRHFELGGYETWIGTNRLEQQASEKMLAALLEMAAEIKAK